MALIMCLEAMLPRRHFKLQLEISPEAGVKLTLKALITLLDSTQMYFSSRRLATTSHYNPDSRFEFFHNSLLIRGA